MLLISLLLTVGLTVLVESSPVGTSMLEMIRKDPSALVKIFDGASGASDPYAVEKISALLEELLESAQQEIYDIEDNIWRFKEAMDKAVDAHSEAVGLERTLLSSYNDAQSARAKAEGELDARQSTYDSESPSLINEIEVFDKILDILIGLLDGQELVEEEFEAVKAFISLSDQADPVTVKKVITLVNKLKKASTDQLNVLESKVNTAKDNLENALAEENKAFGLWEAATEDTKRKKEEADEATGAHDAVSTSGKARIAVVTSEMTTLKNVVELLYQLPY